MRQLVCLAAATAVCGLIVVAGAADDTKMTEAEINYFKATLEFYPPPNEAQAKTLLEGTKAQPMSGGFILMTDPKLLNLKTNGVWDIMAQSPSCIFNAFDHTVSSTNELKIQSADGKFVLEGVGFLLQTNQTLIISNHVHTVILGIRERQKTP